VFSPAQHARDADYYGRVLNKIRCTAAPGYGENRRTKVIVVMGLWSRSRVNNAERLWRLDEAGCEVEAIVASHDLDYKVRAWLRKPGRNGGITFRAASRDFDGDGAIDRYLHEKVVMVNGGYGTQSNAVLTFMGTHNFTYNAFRGNNDVILRIADRAIHARWEEQVALLRQHSALVPRSNAARAARIPPTVDLTQNRANLDSPKAYAD
jgi:phosphatidylserine/phosphatidylglycerophosphate/cardiolipin synthase-like enzyme